MGFTVEDMIKGRKPPQTILSTETVQSALDVMIENDYSQLPVTNRQGKLLGMITNDSIIRALSILKINVENLKVSHAMTFRVETMRPDDDLFSLLDRLTHSYAVLVVDSDHRLVGIVTNRDTTDYFRQRTETNMLVESIEKALRLHILAAFCTSDGQLDRVALSEAIKKSTKGDRDIGVFIKWLTEYLQLQTKVETKIDMKIANKAYDSVYKDQPAKAFDRLTFSEYMSLFLDKVRWENNKDSFGELDRNAMLCLLQEVREMRNGLAHFRSEITPEQYKHLKFCADLFTLHPPTRVLPAEPSALLLMPGDTGTDISVAQIIIVPSFAAVPPVVSDENLPSV